MKDPDRARLSCHPPSVRADYVITKSRRYSTTFTALRQARHDHLVAKAATRSQGNIRVSYDRWRYAGSGYPLRGDHLIATHFAENAIEHRVTSWEEYLDSLVPAA